MCDSFKTTGSNYVSPQCKHFVIRKKRLCRMTVKPGKDYCGEHEPQPKTDDGQDDTRIPCPNDPKHTCYASKLDKHLSICNARQQEQPNYIIHNINSPANVENNPRLPLSKIPLKRILNVIEKVNTLFDTYLKGKIATLPEWPIHSAVQEEFGEAGRTESSLRHLRQASSLLHLLEYEQLVAHNTCYVELGAGKGQLSYYAWRAWVARGGGRVLLVDRAALRHKRDNKLRELSQHQRLRADLAHLALERVPAVRDCAALVGYAKHLCGVATDYALRCVTAGGVRARVRGVVLATCCHHRCQRAVYPAAELLLNLGIDEEDFNILLGLVSWATCGDGRSRDRRRAALVGSLPKHPTEDTKPYTKDDPDQVTGIDVNTSAIDDKRTDKLENLLLKEGRDETENRVLMKEGKVATGHNVLTKEGSIKTENSLMKQSIVESYQQNELEGDIERFSNHERNNSEEIFKNCKIDDETHDVNDDDLGTRNCRLSQQQRGEAGRRAKALLDWGRVLFLRGCGFDARLVHYVPTRVSLENVCIVATKAS